MILFIITPFLGGWIGYSYAPEKVVEVERVVVEEVLIEAVENNLDTKETGKYNIEQIPDNTGLLNIKFINDNLDYSHDMKVNDEWLEIYEITKSIDIRLGGITEQEHTVLVSDYFKTYSIPYSEMSVSNRQFSYDSCCSGQTYHFSPVDQKMYVADFSHDSQTGETIYIEPTPYCSGDITYGNNEFMNIEFSDEGWFANRYFIFTDQDYVLVFESLRVEDQEFVDLLSSVELINGVGTVKVGC